MPVAAPGQTRELDATGAPKTLAVMAPGKIRAHSAGEVWLLAYGVQSLFCVQSSLPHRPYLYGLPNKQMAGQDAVLAVARNAMREQRVDSNVGVRLAQACAIKHSSSGTRKNQRHD